MKDMKQTPAGQVMSQWLQRNFSDPGAVSFVVMLLAVLLVIELFGSILTPILVSIAIAYVLHALVIRLERIKVPTMLAVLGVFTLFLALLVVALLWLLPLLTRQLVALVNQLPFAFAHAKVYLSQLVQRLPQKLAPSQLQEVMGLIQTQAVHLGRYLLSFSLATLPGLVSVILYLVLVPVMTFFFLKDEAQLRQWLGRFLPENRQVINQVLADVQHKIGQYIKGRVIEIFVVGLVSGLVFSWLGMSYAILLAVVVGVSVIVPYVGAVVATIPVVVIALMQWGLGAQFLYVMIAYAVIIFLDANILVPLLFAETMDLHPVAIIIAVLVFGGVWGFWGVFFAIPLATLVKAILDVWPRFNTNPPETKAAKNDPHASAAGK